MTTFKTVAKVGDIPAGEGRAYEVSGRMVAVFFIDDKYQAIDDFCPHMGASLSAGAVEDGTVMCPWHAWSFRISDGTWCDNPKIKVDTFEVQVDGDEIRVGIIEVPTEEPAAEPTEEVSESATGNIPGADASVDSTSDADQAGPPSEDVD